MKNALDVFCVINWKVNLLNKRSIFFFLVVNFIFRYTSWIHIVYIVFTSTESKAQEPPSTSNDRKLSVTTKPSGWLMTHTQALLWG